MKYDLSPTGLVEIQNYLKDLINLPRYDKDGQESWGLPTLVTYEIRRLMEAHPSMTCDDAALLVNKRYAPAKIALALCDELMKKQETKRKKQIWKKQWARLI